jgi:acetyl esterase
VTPLFDTLTKAGFVWFSVDYRLVPQAQFPAPVEDVMAAVHWVYANAGKYKVSVSRVVLLGESAGGQLVGYVGARYGKALGLAGVVDFYGPNDMELQWEKTKDAAVMDYAGANLKEASPITWVTKDIPPFLCIHGDADERVPYEQSPNMCAAITKAGGACEVLTIPKGKHGMGGWKTEWKPQLTDWLRKTLGLS